jgi:hypothetical protein
VPTVFASFSLTGGEDFDPDTITVATGLMPFRQWRTGDDDKHGRKRRHSFWAFEVGPDETFDHAAQVESLLDQIEPYADIIREAVAGLDVAAQIGLWWGEVCEGESTPSLHFPADLLERIARLPATLDIDV